MILKILINTHHVKNRHKWAKKRKKQLKDNEGPVLSCG